jgi:hypothetical protein
MLCHRQVSSVYHKKAEESTICCDGEGDGLSQAPETINVRNEIW